MNTKEMLSITRTAIDKGWDFEQLSYSDDMYENRDCDEEVYEYVIECSEIRSIAFFEKYAEYYK